MDWDQDGKLDILSGCYWTDDEDGGHLQFLKGDGGLNFAESVSLLNVDGQPLQNAEKAAGSADVNIICTEQHAVDYDDDGDLDLVVGCFGTKFFLYQNLAEEHDGKNMIAGEVTMLPIESPGNHASPHLVDWDNDGDLDLLSGSSSGGVILSENTGTRSEPQWASFKQLVKASNLHQQNDADSLGMGPSTRVWATDWNGDGWQDLVVGDSTSIVSPAEGVDAKEWKRRLAEDEQEMNELNEEMQEYLPEYQAAMEKGEQPSKKIQGFIQKISEKMQAVYQRQQEYQSSQSTGHVWLLIRQPPS